MVNSISFGLIAAFVGSVIAQGPIQSCTLTVFNADMNGCSSYIGGTVTYTSYTDCSGCVLSTRRLGVGPQCATITTVSATSTADVVSCSASATST
ncbi:hypothetical protein MBLNU459_g7036t1 [Dothideomycetes sp. NU459]